MSSTLPGSYEIYPNLSPSTKFGVDKLGPCWKIRYKDSPTRTVEVFSIRKEGDDRLVPPPVGYFFLDLPYSTRILQVNVAEVISVEPVTVWRSVLEHENPNFIRQSPYIRFFYTHRYARVRAVEESNGRGGLKTYNTRVVDKLFDTIAEFQC